MCVFHVSKPTTLTIVQKCIAHWCTLCISASSAFGAPPPVEPWTAAPNGHPLWQIPPPAPFWLQCFPGGLSSKWSTPAPPCSGGAPLLPTCRLQGTPLGCTCWVYSSCNHDVFVHERSLGDFPHAHHFWCFGAPHAFC
jgi:hypothetical protein